MPRSESSFSKPAWSTKSRRTGSWRSFFQSIRIALRMWFLSYAEVSSSTSTTTTFGSSRWAWTHSASTRTSLRLMLLLRSSCGRQEEQGWWRGSWSKAQVPHRPSLEDQPERHVGDPGSAVPSRHATQAGGHAAQVDRPPLREIRLSLHGHDARERTDPCHGCLD